MRTTKSQLEINEKTSETVVYAQLQDSASETSMLESLTKFKHKRRPSSVTSAERIFRERMTKQHCRDYSPN